jgi:prevent-host-death family protein
VKQITISELRKKCYAILRAVERTKEPVQITRRSKPIAQIWPVSAAGDVRKIKAALIDHHQLTAAGNVACVPASSAASNSLGILTSLLVSLRMEAVL